MIRISNLFSFIKILHSCSTRELGHMHKFACEKFIFHSTTLCPIWITFILRRISKFKYRKNRHLCYVERLYIINAPDIQLPNIFPVKYSSYFLDILIAPLFTERSYYSSYLVTLIDWCAETSFLCRSHDRASSSMMPSLPCKFIYNGKPADILWHTISGLDLKVVKWL